MKSIKFILFLCFSLVFISCGKKEEEKKEKDKKAVVSEASHLQVNDKYMLLYSDVVYLSNNKIVYYIIELDGRLDDEGNESKIFNVHIREGRIYGNGSILWTGVNMDGAFNIRENTINFGRGQDGVSGCEKPSHITGLWEWSIKVMPGEDEGIYQFTRENFSSLNFYDFSEYPVSLVDMDEVRRNMSTNLNCTDLHNLGFLHFKFDLPEDGVTNIRELE